MSETAEDTAKITTNSLHEVMYELSIAAKINDLEGPLCEIYGLRRRNEAWLQFGSVQGQTSQIWYF